MLYYGPFIYVGGDLSKVLTTEGYIDTQATNRYHYYLKDHLGNTRMTINYSGTIVDDVQTVEYYPFGSIFSENGLDKNLYLYNGKELNNEFFENYDYGARFYDAVLGRFHTLDPLSEKYNFQTPYAYASNDPVRFIDVMGMGVGAYGMDEIGAIEYYDPLSSNDDKKKKARNKHASARVSCDKDSKSLEKQEELEKKGTIEGESNTSDLLGIVFAGVTVASEAGEALSKLNINELKELQNILEVNHKINSIKINDQLLKIARHGKLIKGIGFVGNVANLGVIGSDIINQGGKVSGENMIDGIFGFVAFVPKVGWVISSAYTLNKEASKMGYYFSGDLIIF